MSNSNIFVLCQPDKGKSCGACCGLYNYVDSSRSSLALRLRSRTERFHKIVKNPGDVERYASQTLAAEDFKKRYEVIHCCEYLGFLDKDEKKVIDLLLNEGNAVFQASLMEKLEIGKVKTTRLLDKLEAKQLIERKRRGMNNIVVLKD